MSPTLARASARRDPYNAPAMASHERDRPRPDPGADFQLPDGFESDETADLVQRAQAGDADALNDLFARYHRIMVEVARKKLGPRLRLKEDPDDLAHEVNETNNGCSSTVMVKQADLTARLSTGPTSPIAVSEGINWFLKVTNQGDAWATFGLRQVIVRDNLDASTGAVYLYNAYVINATSVPDAKNIACRAVRR